MPSGAQIAPEGIDPTQPDAWKKALTNHRDFARSTEQRTPDPHLFFATVAGTTRRSTLSPKLFPIPDPVPHRMRQSESKLMREQAHLPAMMGLMSKHVAQHLHANRPRRSPAVSAKPLDTAPTPKRITQHLPTTSGALGQSRTSLLRRAVRTV